MCTPVQTGRQVYVCTDREAGVRLYRQRGRFTTLKVGVQTGQTSLQPDTKYIGSADYSARVFSSFNLEIICIARRDIRI
jgi:hypothetical protein